MQFEVLADGFQKPLEREDGNPQGREAKGRSARSRISAQHGGRFNSYTGEILWPFVHYERLFFICLYNKLINRI